MRVHLTLAVFVTGILVDDFNIDLNSVGLLVVLIYSTRVVVVVLLVIISKLIGMFLSELPEVLSGVLDPSFEGHSEVHHGQEWVHTVLLLDDVVVDVIVGHALALVLS
jgi:hypothetical protein